MLPKAPPAVSVLALAGKAASGGRAPLMPGKAVVVLAGARMSARLRRVVVAAGRDGFSGEDFKPKVPLDELIKKLAKETSLLLQDVGAPAGCPFQDLACFAVEMGGLREVCYDMVGPGGGFDPDGAISTLLGVQARVRLLLSSRGGDDIPGSTESLEAFLLSSTHKTKMCITQYTVTQGAAAEGDADFSGEDPKPKVTCAQLIEKLAKETSSLLRDVRAPKDCTSRDRMSFSMELCGLQGACHKMIHVGRGGLDEDVAISKLIGDQARIRLVLSIRGGHEEFPGSHGSLEDLLLSSLHETEMIIKQYITAQEDAAAAGGDGDAGKAAGRDDGGAGKAVGKDDGGPEKAAEGEAGDAE